MTDHLSKIDRSKKMSRIRGKDSVPEISVRRLLHSMGFRFRLHRRDIPGNPDIVLPKYRTVVFVHGCYWHRHKRCRRGQSTPSTNAPFWLKKFDSNVARDRKVRRQLLAAGWRIVTVWECEVKAKLPGKLEKRLRKEISG